MNGFMLTFCLIFPLIGLQTYAIFSDGFKWTLLPSQRTRGHVGSTVHLKWYYECNDFGSSRIYYNKRHLFSRNANKRNYSGLKNKVSHFSVIGGSNVTIIIPDVDKNESGSYCCEVECENEGHTTCTFLVIYALPRINYLTSHLYGNQGDSITLRCNASGYPAPNVTWIHKDTNKKIANSSATSFNITDKASGGKYCCHVSNGFGNETNCTSLEVIALPRINYLTSHLYGNQGDSITLRCNASGNPAPRITWIHKDTNRTIANSSATSFNITGKESEGEYCCHVSSRFGNETNCTSLEVIEYQPIDTELTSQKNCTTANKTLKILCKADASPSVQYIIQEGNKTVVNSSDGNAKITTSEDGYLNFSCIAKNKYGQGKTVHLEIPICRDNFEDNDDDGSILPHDNRLQIIIVIIVCSLLFAVALILVYVLISRKRKRSKRDVVSGTQQQDRGANQWAEECPYGEPVDAIRVRSVIHASASNADYATVEETGYKRVTTSKTVQQPTHDETSSSKKVKSNVEPVYAIVNKNKKKNKSADVPLNSLNDEKPADLSNPKPQSINHPDPKTSDNKNSNEEEDGVDSSDQGGSWLPWPY